ncbi:hypothetical protein [Rhizobium wenxiniae]|uniref:hypothetical protein n=1 Tax=Rhizobium wenxiniae TaxID=1737357 RepID=UPI003C19A089
MAVNFEQLPFVATVDGRLSCWVPERSGDYETDCISGRRYFTRLLDLMRRTDNPLLLSRVMHAQVTTGQWEAVEIGFAQAMSEKIMADGHA